MTLEAGTEGEETSPAQASAAQVLITWLALSVRDRRTNVTAPLRRSGRARPPQALPGMPTGVTPEIAIRVARMFVRYHLPGDFRYSLRSTGYGDIGQALRRLSRCDPPEHPWQEAANRSMESLLHPRHQLPLRELEHALDTMHRARLAPPSWPLLIDDLTNWNVRSDSYPRNPRERWGWSFYDGPSARTPRPRSGS
ncbi:type I-E CRISPR-associated protein Cse2/CasB [Streptomyces goshikiensis]|uniref:type I-E CRISPR-associated protein Cse2/CasB n=1 Tax=Streptomyces goshikiensis TaxID=1942 RepID=UPI003668CA1A